MVSGNFSERTSHPAQYPEELVERIILAGTNHGDIILDPFMGSGTSAVVAKKVRSTLFRVWNSYRVLWNCRRNV